MRRTAKAVRRVFALYFVENYAIIKLPMRKREFYAVLLIFQGFGHVRFHAH